MINSQQHDGGDSIGEWVQKSSVDNTVVAQQKKEGEVPIMILSEIAPTCSR